MINVLLYLGILGLLIFHYCSYQICISNICLHPAHSSVIYESTDSICTPCLNTSMLSLQNWVRCSLWPIFFLGHCTPHQSLQHHQFTWPFSAFDSTQQTGSFFVIKHWKFPNYFCFPVWTSEWTQAHTYVHLRTYNGCLLVQWSWGRPNLSCQ